MPKDREIHCFENQRRLIRLEDRLKAVYDELYPLLQRSDELGVYKAIGLEGKLRTRLIMDVANYRGAVAQLLRHHLRDDLGEEEVEKRELAQGIISHIEEANKLSADIRKIELNPDADHSDIEVGKRAA